MRAFRFILTSALFGLSLLAGSAAWAKPEAGKLYEDWIIECEKKGQEEHCFATQIRGNKENQPILKISYGYMGPKGEPAMVVVVPLGVAVQPGIGIKVGKAPQKVVPILQCNPLGCINRTVLSQADLDEMLKAKEAYVGFVPFGDSKTVIVPLSMKGFSDAVKSLK